MKGAIIAVMVIILTGCSMHFKSKYGYQRKPWGDFDKGNYPGKWREIHGPKMYQLFPMSYYAKTPNP
jgi:hypothetical protein